MKFTLKLALAILIVASVACTMYAYQTMEEENLKRVTHETYKKGEANYDFCMKLCTDKGGVNCGGTRKGCCKQGFCHPNKVYGWDECERGKSQRLGTDRCIGSWN